jgi:ABC transporter substrate binding protein
MRRRDFITLLGGAAAWPVHAHAQASSALLRVGIVSGATPRNATPFAQLDQRLRELGYIDGQNFALEFIPLNGQVDRYGEAMKELVRRKVDIIIAFGTEAALKGAIAATDTLPIVMVAVDYDPLASGYVASLARPGGRITGVFLQQIDLAVKRAQLMKDAFPDMRAATVFWDRISEDQWQAMQSAARNFGLQLEGSNYASHHTTTSRLSSRFLVNGAKFCLSECRQTCSPIGCGLRNLRCGIGSLRYRGFASSSSREAHFPTGRASPASPVALRSLWTASRKVPSRRNCRSSCRLSSI